MTVAVQDGIAGKIEETANAIQQVLDAQKTELGQALDGAIQLINAPKKVVRGPDGRAVGVEINGVVRTIERGPDGRINGV